jgi:predicted RNA-binding protein with PIN domain
MTEPEPEAELAEPLPPAVRQRVVSYAAAALGALPADDVPAPLKAVARFAPTKRARSGAGQLAVALDADPVFRQRVAVWLRGQQPELAQAVEDRQQLPAADPVAVAAAAYLLRPVGWVAQVAGVAAALAADQRTAGSARERDAADRLAARLEAEHAASAAALEQSRTETAQEAAKSAQVRRRLREVEAELGRARAAGERGAADLVATERAAREAASAAELELRRLRVRLADAEAALDGARRAAREGRNADSVRLRLLMDTVVEAAHGLRKELALPPLAARPADAVAAKAAVAPEVAGVGDLAARALAVDDPALLDQLLELPQVHLVVDGYNVTKTGYGTLSLAEQRQRLVSGLSALAGRTRAEVTCVFDGTTLDVRVAAGPARGVRVLFSPEGQTADELIRRLVRAEPPGRPVVVVSSDREVADGVRAAGARPVPSRLLLRRLDRA